MLSDEELKTGLHSDISQREKLLLVLAALDRPSEIREIKEKAVAAGLRITAKWNPSARLGQAKGLAILTPKGWEITTAGKQHLRVLGFGKRGPATVHIATQLRALLDEVKDQDTKEFVDEAIRCYEAEMHRSSIVMSWLAAVDVLYRRVCAHHLPAFNKETLRIDPKWKPASTPDDLGRMKEGDFLDRLAAISVIGKNVKTELKNCLDRRNGCGHPNSLKIGPATVDHHLEILLLNVFRPFA